MGRMILFQSLLLVGPVCLHLEFLVVGLFLGRLSLICHVLFDWVLVYA